VPPDQADPDTTPSSTKLSAAEREEVDAWVEWLISQKTKHPQP